MFGKYWIAYAFAFAVSGCGLAAQDPAGLPARAIAGGGGGLSFAAHDFTRVVLAGPDNVVVRRGAAFAVTATGGPATLERLIIRVSGDTLEVRRKHGYGDLAPATVTVTMPALTELTLAGSGDLSADQLTGASGKVTVAGSGQARVAAVDARKLEVTIAGSGTLTAAGRADAIDANIVGSGNLAAAALTGARADVTVAGSGDVTMAVSGNAAVSIIGSGDVTLTGGAHCTTTRMGSGSVHCS